LEINLCTWIISIWMMPHFMTWNCGGFVFCSVTNRSKSKGLFERLRAETAFYFTYWPQHSKTVFEV